MRNQEIDQFGPWLHANSPTHRTDKVHDRHTKNDDSRKYANAYTEEGPTHNGTQGKKDFGQKRQTEDPAEKAPAQNIGEGKINGPKKEGADMQEEIEGRVKVMPKLNL